MLFMLQVARNRLGQHCRRLRNDGGVSHHAANFLHQIFRDGNIFGSTPAWDGEQQFARVELLRSLGFRGSWTIEFVHGLLTERDHPAALLEQAADDLAVLRSVLA